MSVRNEKLFMKECPNCGECVYLNTSYPFISGDGNGICTNGLRYIDLDMIGDWDYYVNGFHIQMPKYHIVTPETSACQYAKHK